MDQEISISTPESMEFSHEPAGIGSRFVASIIDTVLQSAMMLGLFFVAGLWASPLSSITGSSTAWGAALVILLAFLMLWGYHIFFDMLWNGQTPGKRTAGIRILKDGGYPISFLDSVVRNLLRPVDFLPFSYGVGVVVMLCNSRFKRVGDFAAGTIVVKERRIKMPHSLGSGPAEAHEDIMIGGQRLTNIYELSEAEFDVVRQFIIRRHDLQKTARLALARKIARPLVKKLGLRQELVLGREEEFLEKIARAYGK
ncbi:RDD family protein [Candidatus Poribacteria bacterium]